MSDRPALSPLAVLIAFLAVTFPLWCNAYLSPPDSASYFSVPRSILFGGDLDFADDYAVHEFETYFVYLTSENQLSMDWPIGSGVAWLPSYAIGGALAAFVPGANFTADGLSGIYKLSVLTFVMAAGALALWLGFRMALPHSSPRAAQFAMYATLLGTPVGFYYYMYGLMSHVTSMAAVAVLLYGWNATRSGRSLLQWLGLGIAAGVMTMIRPQNALFLTVFLVEAAALWRRGGLNWRAWGAGTAIAALGAVAAFSPQMILWNTIYGHPLQLPKIEEMHWFAPQLLETLFSDYHGILPWSPVLVLLIPGAVMLWRRDAVLAVALSASVVIQVYVNAANEIWWSGGSFGNRRMVNCGLPFVVLLAAAFSGLRARFVAPVAVALVAWNLLLIARERAGLLSLDHYVPWKGWEFFGGVLSMANPLRFIPAMMGDFAGFGWMARVLFMVVGLAIAAALQLTPASTRGAWRGHVARWGALGAAAYFLLVPIVFAVAAHRTNPIASPELMEILPRENRSLFNGYYEYGFYCLLKNRPEDALAAYEKAASLRPNFANSYRYLATIHWQTFGDAERALEYSGRALDLNPHYEAALAIEQQAIQSIHSRAPHRRDLVERWEARLKAAGVTEE